MSISTKTGDLGQSSLINGQRLDKDALIFEVLGTLDELNSWLGLVVSKLRDEPQFQTYERQLLKIQDTLFYLGAELAGSTKTKLTDRDLTWLEDVEAELESQLKHHDMTKFVLPGGTKAAALLDVARTVCRRAERSLVKHSRQTQVRPVTGRYLNRLSDYLYLLRTTINKKNHSAENVFQAE